MPATGAASRQVPFIQRTKGCEVSCSLDMIPATAFLISGALGCMTTSRCSSCTFTCRGAWAHHDLAVGNGTQALAQAVEALRMRCELIWLAGLFAWPCRESTAQEQCILQVRQLEDQVLQP